MPYCLRDDMKQQLMAFIVISLLLLTACKSSITGQAAATTEQLNQTHQKPTKYTIPDEEPPKTAEENAQICLDQINTLKEEKIKDEYDLLQIKGEKLKVSRELQYKKENPKHEKEVEELTKELVALGKESDKLLVDIDDKKKAIRLLEEKCDLKA